MLRCSDGNHPKERRTVDLIVPRAKFRQHIGGMRLTAVGTGALVTSTQCCCNCCATRTAEEVGSGPIAVAWPPLDVVPAEQVNGFDSIDRYFPYYLMHTCGVQVARPKNGKRELR
mmetsp:Transcript_6138/g.13544  ORF Transcript_6138/g.13544 Transcript_6138/m.13544 type:complete len:115 (+) Transcript_6138:1100-1444(+)